MSQMNLLLVPQVAIRESFKSRLISLWLRIKISCIIRL